MDDTKRRGFMAVTIKDIAAIANVSRGTVDRALNNRAGVNPDVAKNILKIASDLGYRPNKAGKALAARKKSTVIGMALPSINNPFFTDVISGAMRAGQEFADYGIKVIIKEYKGFSVQRQLEAMEALEREDVNAVCIVPIDDDLIRAKIDELYDKNIPVIALNSDLPDSRRVCFVGNDYEKSGRTAAGMFGLITGGVANVLIVTGSIKMLGHNQRIHGFGQLIKEKYPGITIADVIACDDDDETAHKNVFEVLTKNPTIDSMYITAGAQTGAVRAVRESGRGKSFPIICFDDTKTNKELLKNGEVRAIICQEAYRQGYEPIKILFEMLINARKPKNEHIYTDIVIKIPENTD